MNAHRSTRRLRDLQRQIAEASAQLKAAIAAADHEQEAKLRSAISCLLDEIDSIFSNLTTQIDAAV
jgi:protein-arginine kinase activator protein McsA